MPSNNNCLRFRLHWHGHPFLDGAGGIFWHWYFFLNRFRWLFDSRGLFHDSLQFLYRRFFLYSNCRCGCCSCFFGLSHLLCFFLGSFPYECESLLLFNLEACCFGFGLLFFFFAGFCCSCFFFGCCCCFCFCGDPFSFLFFSSFTIGSFFGFFGQSLYFGLSGPLPFLLFNFASFGCLGCPV